MKKLLGLMAIAIVAFAFSACGSKNDTPEAAVSGYLKCIQKMDFDGFKDVVYFENEEEQQQVIQAFKEKAENEEFRSYMQFDSFEIGEVDMAEDGQSAKVHYTIIKGDKRNESKEKVILKDGKWLVKI